MDTLDVWPDLDTESTDRNLLYGATVLVVMFCKHVYDCF